MSGGLGNVGEQIKQALYNCAWGASYGLAVGSAAGYLATAMKITKSINFVNLGLSFATGLGTYWLLLHAFSKIGFIQDTPWIRELVNHVALPILAVLAAIYVTRYASLTVYTIAAVAAGAFILGNWLQPSPKGVQAKA